MCFCYNIVAHTESETGSLSGRFGGEKWLVNFIENRLRNSIAVIAYPDFYFCTDPFRTYRYCRLVVCTTLLLPFIYGIEGIGNQIQNYTPHILSYNIKCADALIKISFHRRIKRLVLCAKTVVR